MEWNKNMEYGMKQKYEMVFWNMEWKGNMEWKYGVQNKN